MALAGDTLTLRSHFRASAPAPDISLTFDPNLAHATLLGHVTPSGDVALPAVLHSARHGLPACLRHWNRRARAPL